MEHVKEKHEGDSHHRYDWSGAHVADQSTEERLTPQVTVVFPKKILRCLTHKTDTHLSLIILATIIYFDHELNQNKKANAPKYLHQFEAHQFEPSPLEATEDFAHQFPLHAIWLHGDEGALIHTSPA